MGPFVGLLTRDYHSWLESLAHIWGIILAGGKILGHGADADGLHATYVLVHPWHCYMWTAPKNRMWPFVGPLNKFR